MKHFVQSGSGRLSAAVALLAIILSAPVAAVGYTPWSVGGWQPTGTWSSIPGYGSLPYSYRFMNPYSAYIRGGNSAIGFYQTSPNTFLYQRPGFAGGPYGYIQGWVSPQGDFEGTMVIRGNMRRLMGNYYKNLLYNYYLNNY